MPQACGVLVPQPGIEPMPLALAVQSLNHWTTRDIPKNNKILKLQKKEFWKWMMIMITQRWEYI